MKPNTNQPLPRIKGSVLVVALVISAVGTIGVLATVSIIGARSLEAESHFDGLDRRVILNNSKALAREAIYRNYLPNETVVAAETTFSYDTWAKVKIGDFDKAALSFGDAARTHPTGAAPIRAFSQDLSVKVNDGSNDYGFQYQMRSYNPALAGDLLSIHPSPQVATEKPRISGDLIVKGRAVFWDGGEDYYDQSSASSVKSEVVIVPASNPPKLLLEDPDGAKIKPSNFISFNQTMGQVSSGNTYKGELDIVDNSETGVNSYFNRLSLLGGEASFDGADGVTDGLGPEEVVPRLLDSTLISIIEDITQTDAATIGLLAANAPLSSDVMISLLTRYPQISPVYLVPLLFSQSPLPDDVMIALADPAKPISEAARNSLLSSTAFSYISDGKGTVFIDLDSVYLPNLILEDVSRLVLRGQYDSASADAAKLMQPRAIAIKNSNNVFLSEVSLEGLTNQRRIALAISQTGVLDGADLIDTTGAASTLGTNQTKFVFRDSDNYPTWKMITETEGVSQHWDLSNIPTDGITLEGGIRADHSIRVSGGTLTLEKEDDPTFIESLVSRNAWIETYK